MGPSGKELVAFVRKPADHDQSAFQGIHALRPLILVDEVCGVPKSIFDAVDALATNSNARVLAIGNPDDPASHFAQICTPGLACDHRLDLGHAGVHGRESPGRATATPGFS